MSISSIIPIAVLSIAVVAFVAVLIGFFIRLGKTFYRRFVLKGPSLGTPVAPVVYQPIGAGFWWRWVGVMSVAGGVCFLASYFLPSIVGFDLFRSDIGAFITGGLFGAFLGVLQSRLLRSYMPRSSAWLWACVVTWAIEVGASLLAVNIFYRTSAFVVALLPSIGALAGCPQWLTLKVISHRAKWWIGLNAIGWTVTALLAVWISLPVLQGEGDLMPFVNSPWVVGTVLGLVHSIFSATALVWIIKDSSPTGVILQPNVPC